MTLPPIPSTQPHYPSSTPDWFLTAVHCETSVHVAISDAVEVRYRCWNAPDSKQPPLLLVHGFRGHSHWWDFIAPYLKDRFRVFALDLSGMGDSGHRSTYTSSSHSGDITAVLRAIGGSAAIVVGHSYGGSATLAACAAERELIQRAIILDSHLSSPEDIPGNEPRKPRRSIPYADYDSARARFRLMPPQPAKDYTIEHVARHSLRPVAGGWTWKFDPGLITERAHFNILGRIDVPVDIVVGERSSVIDERQAERIVAALRWGRGPVVVPEAGHHLMLDRPLATITALRALLAPGTKARATHVPYP